MNWKAHKAVVRVKSFFPPAHVFCTGSRLFLYWFASRCAKIKPVIRYLGGVWGGSVRKELVDWGRGPIIGAATSVFQKEAGRRRALLRAPGWPTIVTRTLGDVVSTRIDYRHKKKGIRMCMSSREKLGWATTRLDICPQVRIIARAIFVSSVASPTPLRHSARTP